MADLELALQLKFTSGSLATYLKIGYAKKMPSQPGNEPDDVEGKLYKILPAGAFIAVRCGLWIFVSNAEYADRLLEERRHLSIQVRALSLKGQPS